MLAIHPILDVAGIENMAAEKAAALVRLHDFDLVVDRMFAVLVEKRQPRLGGFADHFFLRDRGLLAFFV